MSDSAGEKIISTNASARSDYLLEEFVEAGIVLTGTEIKSIRTHSPNLKECFVEVSSKKRTPDSAPTLEAWIVNLHIAPYSHGNIWNHDVRRRRKLLLHKHQIKRMFGALTTEGRTIVATKLYFLKGRVKIEVALAKGKKKGDKRQDVKKRDQNREMEQAIKKHQKR